jgi:O-antigen/teichoic acid export membrane protein
VGGQQLYTFFNSNVQRISPSVLNQLKVTLFALLLPCLFFIDSWQLVSLIALGYLFESLNNSYRFKLFEFGRHSVEARIYLAERLITFLFILTIYALNYFSTGVVIDLMMIFTFVFFVKALFFIVNRISSNKIDDVINPIGLSKFINYIEKGKYFIFSAFVAALFMQIDILIFSWLDAGDQEVALISALLRLVTATFFIATVFQQFILPKFQLLLANKKYFFKYECYVSYFAFSLTFSLIALCDVYLSLFFGDNMPKGIEGLNVSLLLLLVFTRFSRDPVSLYLGQTGKNKVKVKVLTLLLPLKVLTLYFGYLHYGFIAAICVIVIFDSLIYLLFRYVTQFNVFVPRYCLGAVILIAFICVIELLPFPVRIAIALGGLLCAFFFFSKVIKLGVSFK